MNKYTKQEVMDSIVVPTGYIEIFPKDNIPSGWTPLDGTEGTPNEGKLELRVSRGHSPDLIYDPNFNIMCMYNWKEFKKQNPEWKGLGRVL